MTVSRRHIFAVIVFAGLISAATAYLAVRGSQTAIKMGITPFQDTVLPVVPEELGWYNADGYQVQFVDVGWTDVMLGLASKSFDVVLYSFEATQPAWQSLKDGGTDIVFYAPLYAFNGAAIMVHPSEGYQTLSSLKGLSKAEVDRNVREVMQQLKGKKIGITEGTIAEKVVLDALAKAGMSTSDVVLINARYEDNLAAFLANKLDAFVGGLTERVKAKEAGAIELLIQSAVSDPAITGWVTTKSFVDSNPKIMQSLIDNFYRTVRYMEEDLQGRAHLATDYLKGKASVDYTPSQYAYAWNFQYFPTTREEAVDAFLNPQSPYFWKVSWQDNNDFLMKTNRIKNPVPFSAFWGEKTLPPQ